MDAITAILSLTQRYFSDVEQVMSNLKLGDGLFGLGNDPKKHPCHMAYYEAMAKILSQAESQALSKETLDRIVTLVLRLDADHREQSEMVGLMLQAVQGLTLPLIPRLSQGCAQELAAWYEREYPRKSRMPNQSKVLRALKRQTASALRV